MQLFCIYSNKITDTYEKKKNFLKILFYIFAVPVFSGCSYHNKIQKPPWPQEVQEVAYISSADSTNQRSIIYVPLTKKEKLPLLVALHTWSGNYQQKAGNEYAEWCIQNNWYLIHPNFRGPNNTKQAMGSEYVIKDIVDAVEYMKENYSIDENRIYLIGNSGGGHASLLMAGRHPEIWAGASAWNGISDIKKWWEYSKDEYAPMIEAAIGGRPDTSETLEEECVKRSPITYLQNAKSVKLDINTGIYDETVPCTHSLSAYNKIVDDKDKISNKHISQFFETKEVPAEIKSEVTDINYGENFPVFRKTAGNTRVTVFKGGHEIIHLAALKWLAQQRKDSPPVWD